MSSTPATQTPATKAPASQAPAAPSTPPSAAPSNRATRSPRAAAPRAPEEGGNGEMDRSTRLAFYFFAATFALAIVALFVRFLVL